jgi:hypothetical protein
VFLRSAICVLRTGVGLRGCLRVPPFAPVLSPVNLAKCGLKSAPAHTAKAGASLCRCCLPPGVPWAGRGPSRNAAHRKEGCKRTSRLDKKTSQRQLLRSLPRVSIPGLPRCTQMDRFDLRGLTLCLVQVRLRCATCALQARRLRIYGLTLLCIGVWSDRKEATPPSQPGPGIGDEYKKQVYVRHIRIMN